MLLALRFLVEGSSDGTNVVKGTLPFSTKYENFNRMQRMLQNARGASEASFGNDLFRTFKLYVQEGRIYLLMTNVGKSR
jgi:hypothetical protein